MSPSGLMGPKHKPNEPLSLKGGVKKEVPERSRGGKGSEKWRVPKLKETPRKYGLGSFPGEKGEFVRKVPY